MALSIATSLSLASAYGYFWAGVIWGVHTMAFCLLLRLFKGGKVPNPYLRAACIFGYASNTLAFGLFLYNLSNFLELDYLDFAQTSKFAHIQSWINWVYSNTIAVSDSVQVWRCLVIWGFDRRVSVPLGALLCISILSGLLDSIANSIVVYGHFTYAESSGFATSQRLESVVDAIWLPSSILTNTVATILMVARIRKHARKLNRDTENRLLQVKKYQLLVALIVESGLIYTLPVVIYLTTYLVASYNEGLASAAFAVTVICSPISQMLAGLYPTTITFFSELARNVSVTYTTQITRGAHSVQFRNGLSTNITSDMSLGAQTQVEERMSKLAHGEAKNQVV